MWRNFCLIANQLDYTNDVFSTSLQRKSYFSYRALFVTESLKITRGLLVEIAIKPVHTHVQNCALADAKQQFLEIAPNPLRQNYGPALYILNQIRQEDVKIVRKCVYTMDMVTWVVRSLVWLEWVAAGFGHMTRQIRYARGDTHPFSPLHSDLCWRGWDIAMAGGGRGD